MTAHRVPGGGMVVEPCGDHAHLYVVDTEGQPIGVRVQLGLEEIDGLIEGLNTARDMIAPPKSSDLPRPELHKTDLPTLGDRLHFGEVATGGKGLVLAIGKDGKIIATIVMTEEQMVSAAVSKMIRTRESVWA